jgi:hypothetical protein
MRLSDTFIGCCRVRSSLRSGASASVWDSDQAVTNADLLPVGRHRDKGAVIENELNLARGRKGNSRTRGNPSSEFVLAARALSPEPPDSIAPFQKEQRATRTLGTLRQTLGHEQTLHNSVNQPTARKPEAEHGRRQQTMKSRHQLEKWLAQEILGKEIPRKPPAKARRTNSIRNEDYKSWIRQQPSVISGHYGCEAAHTGEDGGMAMKASDTTCIPLTPEEHREYHRIGKHSFARKYKLDYPAICARLLREYRGAREGAA